MSASRHRLPGASTGKMRYPRLKNFTVVNSKHKGHRQLLLTIVGQSLGTTVRMTSYIQQVFHVPLVGYQPDNPKPTSPYSESDLS